MDNTKNDMNNQTNLQRLAYRCARMDIQSVQKKKNGTSYAVGDEVPEALMSKHRPEANRSPIKMSAVAKLLDNILIGNRVNAFSDKEVLYAEIDGTPFLVTGNKIQTVADPDGAINEVYALWAYALARVCTGTRTEFSEKFQTCIAEHTRSHIVSAKAAGEMCDSFFYQTMEEKNTMVEVDTDLVIDTVAAAYRTGMFKPVFTKHGSAVPTLFNPNVPMEANSLNGKVKKAPRKSNSERDTFERARAGEYIIPYDWDEESKELIVPLSFLDTYKPHEYYFLLVQLIDFNLRAIQNDLNSGKTWDETLRRYHMEIALTGSPGTGKSLMVYALAATFGLPIDMENLTHNSEEDFAEGKTKIVNGKPQAVPTAIRERVRRGGIGLLEEANLPQAAVIMGSMGQCATYPFTLKENGYKTLHRHPLCILFYTMNVGTAGSKAMSEPFANRFLFSFSFEDEEKKKFIDTLVKSTRMKRYICEWVYDAYSKITESLKGDSYAAADTESILLSLSLRSCEGALRLIACGFTPKNALTYSIVGKIAERDITVAAAVREIVSSLRDLYIEGEVYDDRQTD